MCSFKGDAKIRDGKQKYDFTSDYRTECSSIVDQPILCSFILFVANTVVCLFGKKSLKYFNNFHAFLEKSHVFVSHLGYGIHDWR